MNRFVQNGLRLAGAAVVCLGPAAAADLAQHKAPEPSARWSGFYVGGFAGGAFGGAGQGYSATSPFLSANLPSLIPFFNDAGSRSLGLRGADFGVETGYDARVADAYVFGVVGDFGASGLSGSRAWAGNLPILGFPYTVSQRLSADWLGSLRLRAGVTPVDNVLIYATGGLAFGRFTYANAFWDQLTPPFLPGNETEAASFRGWRAGWTLGAGVEWALSRNWSVKGEYRVSDYSTVSGSGVLPLQQPPSNVNIAHSAGPILVHSLHAGVDYHFD